MLNGVVCMESLYVEWCGMYGKFPVFVCQAPAGSAVSSGKRRMWGVGEGKIPRKMDVISLYARKRFPQKMDVIP